MGCVSSKGFRRGPDRVSWHSPLSRNVSAYTNQRLSSEKDVDHDHSVPLTSSSYGELDAETCQGSFLNMRNKTKHYKVLPPDTELEDSFTFTSNLDVNCTMAYEGTQPTMQGDKRRSTYNTDLKPVRVQKSIERDEKRKHHLMCDYLNMQNMVAYKGAKGSLWEDENKGLLVCDNNDRDSAGRGGILQGNGSKNAVKCDDLDVNHVGACTGMEFAKFDNETKCLLTGSNYDTEIINMRELMEGLEDNARTPSSLSTLSIPEREISFNRFTSVPVGDFDSPVWKKYYMQDNGVSTSTRNMHSLATGSPFNESPRRALSQSSFNDVDECKSVSSIEVPDVNAIGLKILLSPVSSSFHPSPMNRVAHSSPSSFDANMYSAQFCESFDDVKSPYRSRKPSMESIFGSTRYEPVGDDVSGMKSPYRSPNMTRSSSRKPSMESVYGSGSPLFDPSLMATFEEALKASTGVTAYDDWLRFSIDESVTLSSSSASTDAESTPSEQTTEKQSTILLYKTEVKGKAALASYAIKCPPRGEGKVVLYFTSLRGIRKTYEDCCDLRLILRGLGVQVDERDVWMHSQFRSELKDVLDGLFKGVPQVPQLFIKGRYIGGAEVVKQLHEEGLLSYLMDGLAMGLIHRVCNGCGDARFIPCFNCNGSRKVLNVVNKVTQCLACNENGLIMCPMCIT